VTPPQVQEYRGGLQPSAASALLTLRFVVLESGDVTDVQIVESAGEAVDNAVVTAYKSWKFTPGMKQGAKVKVRVTRRQTFLGG
jgi:TonB family protein